MKNVLEKIFGRKAREPIAERVKPAAAKRQNGAGDFRAVEIAPRLLRCEAARQVSGKRFLLNKAPRLPLVGCTMPTTCSCMFLKRRDRRDGDRRLLGAGASRLFAGVDGRKYAGRRLAER